MVEGSVELTIGGRGFMFAPLNFSGLKWFQPAFTALFANAVEEDISTLPPNDAVMSFIAEAALRSIRRNEPEVTLEELEERLDLQSGAQILPLLISISGLVPKDMPGELMPGTPTGA